MQTWNVNVEREFGGDGRDGRLLRIARRSPARPGQHQPVHPRDHHAAVTRRCRRRARFCRARRSATSPRSRAPAGRNYKGLWVTANRRMSKGLQLSTSYTLSKSTDTNSYDGTAGWRRTTVTSPTATGRRTSTSGIASASTAPTSCRSTATGSKEGWQVTGVLQLQSGNPLNVVTNINTFTGIATLRPDLVGDPAIVGSATQWFANSVCDPRIAAGGRRVHLELGVRAAGLGGRRGPLRQPAAQRDHRTGLQRHRPVAHQERQAGRAGPRAAARRGVQPVQPGEPRTAGPHRARSAARRSA